MSKKVSRKTNDGRLVLKSGEYQRKPPRVGFEYKWRDDNGRLCSISAPTLSELREKEKEVTRQQADGIKLAKQRRTLNDFFTLWKKTKDGLKANTFSNYCYMYDKFVKNELGKKKIGDIKYSDVVAFYKRLNRERNMSIHTMDVIQNVLSQVFDLAVKDNIIYRNPAHEALKELKRKAPKPKKRSLSLAEQARFLEVLEDPANVAWKPVFGLMLYTGMRVGEISGLTWDDIDYENNRIHVNHTLVYYKDGIANSMLRRINTTKTAAGFRSMTLNDDEKELLELQKKNIPCHATIDGIDNFIFATRFGDTHSQQTLNRALHRITKTANADKNASVLLPYFSCHQLRHTFATNCVRSGMDVTTLMALLGHTDVQTTIGVYTDVHEDMSDIADEKIREYINSVVKLDKRNKKR